MTVLVCVLYAVMFLGAMWWATRRSLLWASAMALLLGVLFFAVAFPGLRIGQTTVPGIAMWLTGSRLPLPVPRFAFWTYLVLVGAGVLLVTGASQENLDACTQPISEFLVGDEGHASGRKFVLYVAIPLLMAIVVFVSLRPGGQPKVVGRQAHPSIAYDEKLKNPLRHPSAETLGDYGASGVKELHQRVLGEGRHLYAKLCSHCHGGKADGTGPMARGLALPPTNFHDPGTIATLVEGYAFKRVERGGPGLPASGTPWDSAMPRWKGELSREEIFKILLAEYDLAGVSPRVVEKLK